MKEIFFIFRELSQNEEEGRRRMDNYRDFSSSLLDSTISSEGVFDLPGYRAYELTE
jgi:hypothetical protein